MARIWLLYDSLLVPGGAEAVTAEIARVLDVERIVVAGTAQDGWAQWPDSLRSRTHVLCKRLSAHSLTRVVQTIRAFSSLTIPDDVTVVYSGCYAPVAVQNQKAGKRFYYCHTPPRFAFDLYELYRQQLPWALRPILAGLARWVRQHFLRAMREMPVIIANSRNVAQRMAAIGAESDHVIHPPVDTRRFISAESQGFFLSTARLEVFKRVDLIVSAFLRHPELQLVIASGGSQLAALKSLAGGAENIRFTGWLSSAAMADYVSRCHATVYIAKDEDFGMSPVESMAAGKPVLGADSGGLRETVIDGETGWLLPERSLERELDQWLTRLPTITPPMREACRTRAETFSTDVFARQLASVVA